MSHPMRKILIWLFAVAVVAALHAQVTPPTYRLGPEDLVTVTVLKHPELSGDFLVPPDGTIDLPAAGKLAVTEKTLVELSQQILAKLRDRFTDPEVAVTLKMPRMQRLYVLGAVTRPNVYDLKAGWCITEALAAAGGVAADPQEVTVILTPAGSTTQQRLKLTDILAAKANANLPLHPGDTLLVDVLARIPVYVNGAVQKPGLYDLRLGAGAVEALAAAGGLTLLPADVKMKLTRAGADTPVASGTNPALQRGDVLTVETLRDLRVMVSGQVKTPGLCALKAGESLTEAVALAGGLTAEAADCVAVLTRGGAKQVLPLSAVYGPGATQKPALQSGDLLSIDSLRTVQVMVTGQVARTGLVNLKDGEGLVAALTLAGGPKDTAGLDRVKVVRAAGGTEVLDISAAFAGKGQDLGTLKSGDLVLVPENTRYIAVLGYVGTPGYFPLRAQPPVTLSDALGMARGFEMQRSGIETIAVLRTDEKGVQQRMLVNLGKFFASGDPKCNPVVQPGDIIYVPPTKRPDWNGVFQMLTSAAVIFYYTK
jgi:polysaccharide export outer membrane protein